MSTDLLWLIVKKNNTFVVKRNGINFSKDPTNLTNLHNKAQCGFIRDNAIGINGSSKGNQLTVIYTTNQKSHTPAKARKTTTVRGNNHKQTAKKVVNLVAKTAARDELYKIAQLRSAAIHRSQRVSKAPKAPKA